MTREPRPRNAVLTKKQILDAAEAEFAAKGFDGARLGGIARQAGVQQALIHHYFVDKAGLYREVVDRALGAMSTEGWDILARTVSAVSKSSRKAKKSLTLHKTEVRPLVVAFVELLQRFFAEHGRILAIVRHEASDGGALALEVVRTRIKPVVDAVTAYLDALQGSGELRADVDVRQLSISAMAMVAFPSMEQPMMRSVWLVDPAAKPFQEAARKEIVDMLLLRLLP